MIAYFISYVVTHFNLNNIFNRSLFQRKIDFRQSSVAINEEWQQSTETLQTGGGSEQSIIFNKKISLVKT